MMRNQKKTKVTGVADNDNMATVKAKEKELKETYEAKITKLTDELLRTRGVTQSFVLVARKSPAQFFFLIEQEHKSWSTADLKNVGACLNSELSSIKGKESKLSTAQRLFSYLIEDPKASKNGLIQVIRNLHEELTQEEKEAALPDEIQLGGLQITESKAESELPVDEGEANAFEGETGGDDDSPWQVAEISDQPFEDETSS